MCVGGGGLGERFGCNVVVCLCVCEGEGARDVGV